MPIKNLFETQKKLRKVIYDRFPELKEQRNLSWLRLALQVELGELANEQRSWKMWSDDREPRTKEKVECFTCVGTGDENAEANMESLMEQHGSVPYKPCTSCNETGISGYKNPLLEEYVDSLSFILEIGLEIETEQDKPVESFNYYPLNMHKHLEIDETFSSFIMDAGKLGDEEYDTSYVGYFCHFLGFGETLGFTVEQIVEAYYKKNQINHERQANGY